MFERIETDNNVGLFVYFTRKADSIGNTGVFGSLPGLRQSVLTNIEPGNLRICVLRYFNGLSSGGATKIDHCLAIQPLPDVWSEQLLHFAAPIIGRRDQVAR